MSEEKEIRDILRKRKEIKIKITGSGNAGIISEQLFKLAEDIKNDHYTDAMYFNGICEYETPDLLIKIEDITKRRFR